ncbi:aminotransferase class IV-domain-containing protein [Elsinoe ampelina]|uniref:Aminotransferase class IV-domain-containing protein n=1 Tax=Elsinoe ampelina TaxID=302913 RepID=A0A6A6GDW2_9PEZI|nr:aminotransferase class IV-domain-containing protein [Elsinoe ampelina]
MAAVSARRNASTDSTMYGVGGRRQPFFVLDDQAVEDQYLFTSFRFDKKEKCSKLNPVCCKEAKHVYLFKYHFDRLKDSAKCRGWYDAEKCLKRPIDLFNRVEYAVTQYEQKNGKGGPYKIRIKLKYHGNLVIDVMPEVSLYKKPLLYPTTLELFKHPHEAASRCNNFKVVLDTLPTNKSLHTKSKTEWRPMYDYARFSAGIESYQDAKEVLLYNADGEIMDGTITTPYFYRNGGWVTPHTTCGGQTGTTRRWAVDQNLCTLGTIKVETLRHDEIIWFSNSVKGFFTGRFVATPNRCQAPNYRSNSTSTSSSLTACDTPTSERSELKSML